MKEFLKHLKLKIIILHQKNIWRFPIFFISAILLFVLFISMMIYQSEKISLFAAREKNNSASILNHLDIINDQIQSISQHESGTDGAKAQLNHIHQELDDLTHHLSNKEDINNLSHQISVLQNDVDSQINNLQKNMTGNMNKSYLDATSLPFKVISIDVISSQPFVSVDYQHHQTALEVGDSLAGWKVFEANYLKQTVEFINDKDQLVRIILQG